MSEQTSPVPDQSLIILCHSIVYRMLPKKAGWLLPDGTVLPTAFYRRRIDKDGVSLATTVQAGIDRLAKFNTEVEGARSLHVGWVRDIGGLDVTRKHLEDTHAVIEGLPYYDNNPKEAERLATRLRNISRSEPLPKS